jgi:hypothetical protein
MRTVKKQKCKKVNRTQKGGAARASRASNRSSYDRDSAKRFRSAKSNKGPDIEYGSENLNSYVILNDSQIKDLNFGVIDEILSSKLKLEKHEKGKTPIPKKMFFQWLENTKRGEDYTIKKRYYNVRTVLLNSLEGLDCISNKQNLNANMESYFRDTYKNYMMPTKTFDAGDNYDILKAKLEGAEWFIARPLEMVLDDIKMPAVQGVGIVYIKDQDDITKELLPKLINTKYIITSYIRNPLLYKGRKFQLRVFFLAGFINGFKIAFVAGKSRIITAAENYNKSPEHFNDKAIHDTHFKSTDENAYFPDDFTFEKITNSDKQQLDILKDETKRQEKIDSINTQMRKVFSEVAEVFFDRVKGCSKEYKLRDGSNQADNSYKEFGADIMITDDFQIKLIEINDRPGHNLRDKTGIDISDYNKEFTRYIYEWTMDTVIIPVYNKTEIPEKTEKPEKPVELYNPKALDRTHVYMREITI